MAIITKVTDDSDRDAIATAIAHLRAKQERMPKHWEARRLEVAREIDLLVERWLARST